MIQKYDPDGNVIWTLNEDDAGERIAGIPECHEAHQHRRSDLITNENAPLRVDTDGKCIIWYHSDITAGIMILTLIRLNFFFLLPRRRMGYSIHNHRYGR